MNFLWIYVTSYDAVNIMSGTLLIWSCINLIACPIINISCESVFTLIQPFKFSKQIMRRTKFGLYDKLMVELRNEGPRAFHHVMRMPPAMIDELVERLRLRLPKPMTNFCPNLGPGVKVELTLRHLALEPHRDTSSMNGGCHAEAGRSHPTGKYTW